MRFQSQESASGEQVLADRGASMDSTQTRPSSSAPMTASNGAVLIVCISLGLLLVAASCVRPVECEEQLNIESRQQKDGENELTDTIRYLEKLEKLDKYWSEMARPRFGRSKYKQNTARFAYEQQQPARYGSLVDLINSRLAQKYYSNDAY